MQEVINKLVLKHKVNIHQINAKLSLSLPGHDRLIVENIGNSKIFVCHVFEADEAVLFDPGVELYTGVGNKWIPISIHQLKSFKRYVYITKDLDLILLNEAGQKDLAAFCNLWAKNIIDQNWLQEGRKQA